MTTTTMGTGGPAGTPTTTAGRGTTATTTGPTTTTVTGPPYNDQPTGCRELENGAYECRTGPTF
jgi:hypothetical protein